MGNSVEERRFQRRVISKSGGYAALKGRSSTPFPSSGGELRWSGCRAALRSAGSAPTWGRYAALGFDSSGKPAVRQASNPPLSAHTFL